MSTAMLTSKSKTAASADPQVRPTDPVDHVGLDLWRAFRAYEQAMFERVAKVGFEDIVVADSDVLVHISATGTRLADIAKARGLTKQSIHERVHSLVTRDYLELVADPDDKRARIVRLTKRGHKLAQALKDIKRSLHQEATLTLGVREMLALRKMLAQIDQLLR